MHLVPPVTALAAVLASCALMAHADPITTFQVNGHYQLGTAPQTYTVSGTVTVDVASGQVQNVNLLSDSVPGEFLGTSFVQYATADVPLVGIGESFAPASGSGAFAELALTLPVASLVGYQGGDLCTHSHWCSTGPNSSFINIQNNWLTDGTFTPVSLAPEPSSLSLVVLGIGAVSGVLRKRRILSGADGPQQ